MMSRSTDYLPTQDLEIREKQALTQRYLQNPLSVRWSKLAAMYHPAND